MTALVFLDTETTSLRPDRRAWEIGLIRRPVAGDAIERQWFIDTDDLDLGNADLFSLNVGRFHERHPQVRAGGGSTSPVLYESEVLREVERLTRGAHLAGAVISFDAEVLAARMRAHGICPSWHYHLIEIEALAAGWLNGRRARQNEIVDGYPLENDGQQAPGLVRWNKPYPFPAAPPWKSVDLSRAIGVEPPSPDDVHTALGDARWVVRMWDKIMGDAQ